MTSEEQALLDDLLRAVVTYDMNDAVRALIERAIAALKERQP